MPRKVYLVATAIILVLASGCSGKASDKASKASASKASATTSVTRTDAAHGGDAAGSAKPIASRDAQASVSSIDDTAVNLHFDLLALHRNGDSVTLEGQITNNGPQTYKSLGVDFQEVKNSPKGSFDGPFLVDQVNKKKYLVLLDSEGKCLCTNMQNRDLANGQAMRLFAKFSPPPPDVKTLDVAIPLFGTFDAVPLASS